MSAGCPINSFLSLSCRCWVWCWWSGLVLDPVHPEDDGCRLRSELCAGQSRSSTPNWKPFLHGADVVHRGRHVETGKIFFQTFGSWKHTVDSDITAVALTSVSLELMQAGIVALCVSNGNHWSSSISQLLMWLMWLPKYRYRYRCI